MRLTDAIDAFVTAIEDRVDWKPLWRSRLLGCTVGLLRLAEWRIGYSRWDLAWAMWKARYWYDWCAVCPELREDK